MKICFLAPANSIHSLRWVKFFVQRKHEVHWISLHPSQFPIPEGIRFYDVSFKFKNIIALYRAIKKTRDLILKIKPNVFHVHSAGTYGLVGSFANRGLFPYFLTAWGSDIVFGGKHFIKKWFVKYALKKACLITTDAQHMVEAMVQLGAKENKIKVINFGIDTKRFSRRPVVKSLLEKLGVNGHPTVISLRNFEPVYDIKTLIQAIPLVLKVVPNARFILIGRGSEDAALKKLAIDLKIEDHICFPGFFPNDALPDLLSSVNVYVSTSLSDAGIAASTAEAMACELPAIVSDSGENQRWIENGVNGYLVPVQSPAELSKCIVELLQNQTLGEQIGKAGRKVIEDRNSYEREMEKMEFLYCHPST